MNVPKILTYANSYVFVFSPEATTCKTAMNLQVENVKNYLKTEHKLLEASPYRLWDLDWWCFSLERIKKARWVDIHQSLVYVWSHTYLYIYRYARVYIYTSCVCYLHRFFIVCVYYHHVLTFAGFHFLFSCYLTSWEWRAWDPATGAGPYRSSSLSVGLIWL